MNLIVDGRKSLIYASIPGPKLIVEVLKAGVGGKVKAHVGAEVDNRYAPPVLLEGEVTAIKTGDKKTVALFFQEPISLRNYKSVQFCIYLQPRKGTIFWFVTRYSRPRATSLL